MSLGKLPGDGILPPRILLGGILQVIQGVPERSHLLLTNPTSPPQLHLDELFHRQRVAGMHVALMKYTILLIAVLNEEKCIY